MTLISVIDKAFENNDSVDCIYHDFCKAFDSVPHAKLLQKLLDFGFTGELWAWFQVFLSSCRQCVCVEDTLLDFLPVLSGVLQDSVIGPLFFIIYINDLSAGGCLPSNLLFADDSKCFNRISSTVDCLIFQEKISDVIRWSDGWDLKFNVGKISRMIL